MTTQPLHLPESLRRKVETFASEEGISVDEFVTSAVAEKLSSATEHYLQDRARRASRAQYEAALAQVPSTAPLPPDRFPEGAVPGGASDGPAVQAIAYDERERTLDITFENGAICQYFEVPAEIYHAISTAASPAEVVDAIVRSGPYPVRLAVRRSGANS